MGDKYMVTLIVGLEGLVLWTPKNDSFVDVGLVLNVLDWIKSCGWGGWVFVLSKNLDSPYD